MWVIKASADCRGGATPSHRIPRQGHIGRHATPCVRLGEIPRGLEGEIAWCSRDDEGMGILQAGGRPDQTGKVYQYMEAEGFGIRRTAIPDGGSWDDIFDSNEIDVLVTGNHPGGAEAGVEFARRVIRRNPLIDVLLYGAGKVEPRTVHDRSLYTAIWTQPGADYVERAVSLIRMHRQKWNDVIFLRGMVISQIVDVEGRINDALAAHFRLEPSTPRGRRFEEYILENPMYMLEGKKRALGSILKDVGLGEMWTGMSGRISELQGKRNKLAHCEVDPDDTNTFTSMGKAYTYDRNGMREILRDARLARQRLLEITEALRERA